MQISKLQAEWMGTSYDILVSSLVTPQLDPWPGVLYGSSRECAPPKDKNFTLSRDFDAEEKL